MDVGNEDSILEYAGEEWKWPDGGGPASENLWINQDRGGGQRKTVAPELRRTCHEGRNPVCNSCLQDERNSVMSYSVFAFYSL
jgi:hypothetical protein